MPMEASRSSLPTARHAAHNAVTSVPTEPRVYTARFFIACFARPQSCKRGRHARHVGTHYVKVSSSQ